MEESLSCDWCGHPPEHDDGTVKFLSSLTRMEANARRCLICSILCAGIKKYLSHMSYPVPTDVDDMRITAGLVQWGEGVATEIELMKTTIKLSFFCSNGKSTGSRSPWKDLAVQTDLSHRQSVD